MHGKLATLHTLEKLCVEHSQALEREAERMEAWIKDRKLNKSHNHKKAQQQGKIAILEEAVGAGKLSGDNPVPTTSISDNSLSEKSEDAVPSTTADSVPTPTVVLTSSAEPTISVVSSGMSITTDAVSKEVALEVLKLSVTAPVFIPSSFTGVMSTTVTTPWPIVSTVPNCHVNPCDWSCSSYCERYCSSCSN